MSLRTISASFDLLYNLQGDPIARFHFQILFGKVLEARSIKINYLYCFAKEKANAVKNQK